MMYWLILIAIVLLLIRLREHFVEGNITRPSMDRKDWISKIHAQAPIGASDEEYIKVLQQFYDTIYLPKKNKNQNPTEADVELTLSALNPAIVSPDAMRQIILSGFPVDRATSAVAREEEQVKIKDKMKNLEPRDGRNETYPQTELPYKPEDTRIGELPEGIYEPVEQQDTPRREGQWDDKSTSWTRNTFYNVCQDDSCNFTMV